ncbi:MAG: hypothetical protein EA379_05065 [Phycisphaerales bacterium]|nr:MAG: hypothetical protein EA379_05065 [Phycisphaerales bacterium]
MTAQRQACRIPNSAISKATSLLCALALLLSTSLALAHPGHDDHEPPPDGVGETNRRADPLPDLDDLLGLERDDKDEDAQPDDAPPVAAPDAAQLELDRRLRGEELSDAFAEAVRLMADAAFRLADAADPGVATQRIQEDILRRLDTLIASAEQQQGQSGQGSSSQSDAQQQQQPTPRPGQPDGAQQDADSQQAGSQPGEGTPPGRQEERLRDLRDVGSAAWGALPDRVRDTLLQGAGDRFSDLYESLTEEYYRRLAEQRSDE